MKTKITICTILISIIAVVTFFSCDIPMALGTKLDIEGPVTVISSPSHRTSVQDVFYLTGTVRDDTGIQRMLITVKVDNKVFPRQWRYLNGVWQVSDNYGASWSSFSDGVWNGSANSASWKIKVNMVVPGFVTVEGEYTFTVQAWDNAEFTDDNSIKAVILILDRNPPKVDVSYPSLYRHKGNLPFPTGTAADTEFKKLHDIPDNGASKEFEDPAYLGKFITQEFDLKWQVEDINDVWSIDLRFYKYDYYIDNDTETPLDDLDYIYKFSQNIPPVPANVNPAQFIKPNGTVTIPDLTGERKTYTGNNYQGGILENPIDEKTTIKIVVLSYDAAGHLNQEKTIGYFIYWPRANNPWIIFPDDMYPPVYYPASGSDIATLEPKTYMVYPGKDIKATAYQAYGVDRIEYAVYECAITGAVPGGAKGSLSNTLTPVTGYSGTIMSPGISTIFAWTFKVPPLTGYYVVKATAFSKKNQASKEYEMLFRINDITFPDFPTSIQPAQSQPLYLAMGTAGTQFTITGTVSDATGIDSLCLVWINPRSKDAAANAQLTYFRESKYVGWTKALALTPSSAATGPSDTDGTFDSTYPNKLWKLNPAFQRIDPDTNRRIYTFSKTINLSDLNIGAGIGLNPDPIQFLKSQMFLFRAENPVDKCTIITYAPQGDTVTPAIKVQNVVIRESTTNTTIKATCEPNKYTVLPIFAAGNTINVTGRWREDSVRLAANLNLTTFFKNFFEIYINNTEMNHMANQPALNLTRYSAQQTDSDGTWDGEWTLTTVVGNGAGQVPLSNLKDTLVIDAKTRDIGGNIAQLGSSWLIKSDKLQLLRISSEEPDDVYGTGKKIEIFLEFSKPVKLNEKFAGTKENIQLILSTASGNTARASYRTNPAQNDQNSRQYFVYTVGNGENTGNTATTEYLNVKGLYYNGEYTASTAYTADNYPFLWERGAQDINQNSYEAVRLTIQDNRSGANPTTNGEVLLGTSPAQYYLRTLPTSTASSNADYQFTLFAAKHIKIDTTLPTISAITTTTPSGYYKEGDIYFTVKFSENVKLGATIPQFPLNFGGTAVWSSDEAKDVRVNGDSITFKYTIKSTDTSLGNQVYVSAAYNILGDIYDIAGNKMLAAPANNGLNGLSQANRTLNGIYVETNNPSSPTVRVLPSKVFTRGTGTSTTYTLNGHGLANNTPIYVNGTQYYVRNPATNTIQIAATSGGTNYLNNLGDTIYVVSAPIDDNVISQNVKVGSNTNLNYGRSGANSRELSNIYEEKLYLAIQNNITGDNTTTPYKCDYLEYSIVGGGIDSNYIKLTNTNNTPFVLEKTGDYKIVARQVDKAGNKSAPTNAVNFNWNPGALLTRISSTSANGEYTHVKDGYKQIVITLNFREPLYFSGTGTPEITLNAKNSAGTDIKVTTARPAGQVSSLTFTYNVTNGDYTPASTNLDITAFTPGANVTVLDGNNVGVDVTSLITLPSGTPKLDSTKLFTVVTGPLEFTASAETTEFPGAPAFIENDFGGTGYNTESNSNYHGIRTDDGSYWTTLRMTFNHEINKGDGNIIIKQVPGSGTDSYRLPTVMTEAQYNRFKGISGFDTYYIKGTNGYINGTGSDTTNKYILQYKYDPRRDITTNNSGFTSNTAVPTIFIDAFRDAEAISIPVNSQAVTITNSGKTLNVRLSGSNAPQVPGAIYEVTLPAGLVTDSLGNSFQAYTKNVQLRGVAKPFVRIRKTQDTITAVTGSGTQPRLVAEQPMLAYARMDCRTPGSTITYTANTGQTSVTGSHPGNVASSNSTQYANRNNNNWHYNNGPDDSPTPDATRPGNATTTTYANSNQLTFGYATGTTPPTINNVQGFQWWVRARATTTAANNNTSAETEEMAYRTVISYSIRNGNTEVAQGNGRSRFDDGDQAWIRGGDSIGSSSIPGFPFTWEDNWDNLKEKRAGIRLMSLVGVYSATPQTFTRGTGTSTTYNLAGHGLANNAVIYVNGDSTTPYYVRNPATNTIQIAATSGGTTYLNNFGDTIYVSTPATRTLNNSLWRFVTWDMNTTAYVDFIRGRDLGVTENGYAYTASTVNEAWQYGPKRLCYQVDGWTSFKDKYPIYAGKHRWCDMSTTMGQHGAMNFSGTFSARPDRAVDYTGVNQQ